MITGSFTSPDTIGATSNFSLGFDDRSFGIGGSSVTNFLGTLVLGTTGGGIIGRRMIGDVGGFTDKVIFERMKKAVGKFILVPCGGKRKVSLRVVDLEREVPSTLSSTFKRDIVSRVAVFL